jgi:hypothetical protein
MSRTRFTNTKRRNDNKLQYQSLVIPNFEERTDDTVIEVNDYSRLDVLASDIFGDSTLWWVLASYNNLPGDSLYTTGVRYLRIPSDVNIVYNKVKEVN